MTPEQQRIKIAEACGWTPDDDGDGTGEWTVIGKTIYGHKPLGPKALVEATVPDYLNDLNAMHEAEKVLTLDQSTVYTNLLWPHGFTPFRGIHTTAAQRAEAFLVTLNLWED